MTSFDDLVRRARSLVGRRPRAVLGVTGPPGAGKSTLVEALLESLLEAPPPGLGPDWVAHVPMDGFHLSDVQLDRLGRRDRKGAPDTFDAGGYAALLERLRRSYDETVYVPGFERELEQPIAASIAVPPEARLVLTEGNYLLLREEPWDRVRAQLDEVWYCELDDRTRLPRLIARHERFGKAPEAAAAWARGTDQVNAETVAATRDLADLVVRVEGLELPWTSHAADPAAR